jgi:hypothetical protein
MGSPFLKVEDVEEGPRRVRIVKIETGQYDKPVATFDDNSRLSLNVTNSRALGRAYGTDSRDWIDKDVEQKFMPHIARAWSPSEVELLVQLWSDLHG